MSHSNGNKKSTYGNVTRAELYEYVASRVNATVNDTENRFLTERIERSHAITNAQREVAIVLESMQSVINNMQDSLHHATVSFVLLRAEFDQYKYRHSWRYYWDKVKELWDRIEFRNPFYHKEEESAQPDQSVEGREREVVRESVDGDQCAVQPELRLLSEPRQREAGHPDADGAHQENSG